MSDEVLQSFHKGVAGLAQHPHFVIRGNRQSFLLQSPRAVERNTEDVRWIGTNDHFC